jgi:hypothetical protein
MATQLATREKPFESKQFAGAMLAEGGLPSRFQEISHLRWRQVIEDRRFWTSLSTAVLASVSMILIGLARSRSVSMTGLFWGLGAIALLETIRVWRSHRELRQIQEQLGLPPSAARGPPVASSGSSCGAFSSDRRTALRGFGLTVSPCLHELL